MPATPNFNLKFHAMQCGNRRALAVVYRFEGHLKALHQTEGSGVREEERGMIGAAYNAWVRAGAFIPQQHNQGTRLQQNLAQDMLVEVVNLLRLQELMGFYQGEEGGLREEQVVKMEEWEFERDVHQLKREEWVEAFRVAQAQEGRLVTEADT
jgi:hypothetical protein